MLVRALIFVVLFISCKDSYNSLKQLTDEEIAEIKRQGSGAATDMFIDSEMKLFMRLSHFLAVEPGEIVGATVELESYADIELGAPDADGIASPLAYDGEMPTGKWLRVNLKNRDGNLCKAVVVKDMVYENIVYQLNKWEGAEGYDESTFLYSSPDRICMDDKIVPMRTLNTAMSDYGVGGSLPPKELHDEVAVYKEKQKEFLQSGADRLDVQEFQLRAKMLDGHFALRDKLGLGDTQPEGDLIRSVLGAFVSDSHNVMPSEEILKDEDSLALKLTKVAVAGAVSRFLMYQEQFNAAEFSVDKFNDELNKIQWHADLVPVVASVKTNYPKNVDGVESFTNITLDTKLSNRITYMNSFMRQKIADTGECEPHLEELFQGLQHPEIYYDTLKAGDAGFQDEDTFIAGLGEGAGIVLLTKNALVKTGLADACKTLNSGDLKHIETKHVAGLVADVKQSVIDTLKDLNTKYSKDVNKDKYLPDLMAAHMFALPPVVTFSEQDAAEVIAPLQEASTKMTKKANRDAFWSRFAGIVGAVAGILGIVALISFLFPPAMPVVTTLASLAALLSLVGTAILVPTYTVDWFKERSNYRALERNILSGGSQEYGEQIKHLAEFRNARFEAIVSGASVALVAVPVTKLVANPRAFSAANRPGETVKNLWGKKGAVARPFRWAGGVIRHPIVAVKKIPSAAQRALNSAWNGLGAAKDKSFSIAKGAKAKVAEQGVRKAVSGFLKDSTTKVRAATRAAWDNNVAALKADAAWTKTRAAKKSLKGVKFKMAHNTSGQGGTVNVINKKGILSNDEISTAVGNLGDNWQLVFK